MPDRERRGVPEQPPRMTRWGTQMDVWDCIEEVKKQELACEPHEHVAYPSALKELSP